MKRSSRNWILAVAIIVMVGALARLKLHGFQMSELPFILFGCAIMLYALFSWFPS
jgi:hypothetical protein